MHIRLGSKGIAFCEKVKLNLIESLASLKYISAAIKARM